MGIDLSWRERVQRAGDVLVEPSRHISRKRLRLLWVGAIALALAGNAIYLLMADDWSWYVGGMLALPLLWLMLEHLLKVDSHGGGADGPWGPP